MLSALVLLGAAGVTVPGFYARGVDTVYPNVSLNGIDLSGQTLEQAKQTLIASGYENNADGIAVTLAFPNGDEVTVTGRDAGLSLSAENAAKAAHGYGRGGSFIKNGFSYIGSLLGKRELSDDAISAVDEDYIRSVVTEHTERFNETLLEDDYVIEDDKIVIVKNAGGAYADTDEVADMVIDAMHKAIDEHTAVVIDCPLKNTGDDELDLTVLFNKVNREAKSAEYDTETKSIVDSVTGVSFDMAEAERAFMSAGIGMQIVIPLIFTEPELTTKQLEELLFRDVLSTSKTYIDGTSNRLNNVVLSAAAINGLVLNPDEVFSFNDVVGERTSAKGYKEAGAYVGGRTVQEVGGGICQTSSTLYDAVLYADLEVVYRANHMFTVPYLPYGHDATVNWGTIDFKFKNSTPYPIRIDTLTEGRDITVTIYGTKTSDNYVKYENISTSTTPYETIQVEDESVEPGKTKVDSSGYTGRTVEVYKLTYDGDGNLLDRVKITTSKYRVQDRVVLVPIGTLTETPAETPDGTPEETPGETPDGETVETPPETPDDTSDETSGETQTEAPPEESPDSVPTEVTVDLPDETDGDTHTDTE